eukprot:Skav213325  [mRNA]  locus=scaffold3340:104371:107538:+ [translate_table: standard]
MIEVCKVMRFPAWQLHVLPPDTPWTLAVLAEPLATACKAVRLANLHHWPKNGTEPAPWVVVVGDGAVGLLLLQVLRARQPSAHVCLVGAQPSRLKRAKELGAEMVCDIADLHDLRGLAPQLVLEAAGAPPGRAPYATAEGAAVRGPELCTDDVVLRQLTLRGSLSSEPEDWQLAHCRCPWRSHVGDSACTTIFGY